MIFAANRLLFLSPSLLKQYCNHSTIIFSSLPNKIKRHFTMTTTNDKIIGTHDGVFHCDESLACFMVKLLPDFKDASILRSRDKDRLSPCTIVLDVGGVYDPKILRFDHHQKSFDLALKDFFPKKHFGNVKLSSAGLIYAHFGHEIIAHLMGWNKDDSRNDLVYDRVYETFIKEIDAIDNGINMFEGEPLYQINTHLSQRVANLKVHWNEEETDDLLYERFLKAVDLTGKEFLECVEYYGRIWLPARELIEKEFNQRFQHDPSGRIMVLEKSLPWIQHLFQIEKEQNQEGQVYFVIFKDSNWRVRAVPVQERSFSLRNPLLEKWRGLRDDELCKVSTIEDAVFVHSTGFIGGCKSFASALKMAKESIN